MMLLLLESFGGEAQAFFIGSRCRYAAALPLMHFWYFIARLVVDDVQLCSTVNTILKVDKVGFLRRLIVTEGIGNREGF